MSTPNLKVLILGAHGQLGRELSDLLQSSTLQASLGQEGQEGKEGQMAQDVLVTGWSRADFDFADLTELTSRLESLSPHIILNACAYTAVDLAEDHEHEAFQINAELPERLAQFAAKTQAVLVHYSTDFVFDGQKKTPYVETDPTAPLSAYGRSKLAGEMAIQASHCQHLIFRTGWLMGAKGQNFLRTMLRLGADRETLNVVADQWGAPTPASWLAQMSLDALVQCLKNKNKAPWGLYHASSQGQTTWHGYAELIFDKARELGFALSLKPGSVHGIRTDQYPMKAARPPYSVLSTEKLQAEFNVKPPLWDQAVLSVLKELQTLG